MNSLIQTNLDNINLYDKKDLEFLSIKAFSYFENSFKIYNRYEYYRIPYCGGISFFNHFLNFKDISFFKQISCDTDNWEEIKQFFENFLLKGKTNIESILPYLLPFITTSSKEEIQKAYNKFLNKEKLIVEDIAVFGNLFLLVLMCTEEKSLENILTILYKNIKK